MPAHDMIINNAVGATFRADLNSALAALVSNSSGTSAPATTYAYQFWADTTNDLMKVRNAANSAWINLFTLSSVTGSGRMVLDNSPQFTSTIGLGAAALATTSIRVSSVLSGALTQYGVYSASTFGSDATTAGYGFYSNPSTTAAAYTVSVVRGFISAGFTLGAGSAVTAYDAFYAGNETEAGTHRSFYGNQGTTNASDRNCYMIGAAPNYFNGAVMVGSNADDGVNKLQVTGSISSTATIKTGGYTVATLPAGITGHSAYVTDATAPTYLGALTGGGAVKCPVFYNGTAWVSN